jgi:aminoglycoside phosphotransferase
MLTCSLLPHIAEDLGLEHVRPLRDGEFGAEIVRDRDGAELVLKASSQRSARQVARGGALASRMRDRGYPAPLLVATGAARGASWSLQELLPGRTPDVLTASHARALLDFTGKQERAAGRHRAWRREALAHAHRWRAELAPCTAAQPLADELADVVERCRALDLRDSDVVHGDFSHRNTLAVGDDVTGIIDWDMAGIGDCRLDVVTLAYWCAVEPTRRTPIAAQIIDDHLRDACQPPMRAVFGAYVALRHLAYVARAHPDEIDSLARTITTEIAPWWRRDPPARRFASARRSIQQ